MSNQEQERKACFQLKEKGMTRKEIAEVLGISERQVKRRLSASANGNMNRTKFGREVIADASVGKALKAMEEEMKKLGASSLGDNMKITTGTISTNQILGCNVHEKIGFSSYFNEEVAAAEPVLDFSSEAFSFPLSKDQTLYRYEHGDKQREAIKQMIERKYHGKKVKILYLADLHIPFTMYEEVLRIVKENSDADIVVINGDLLDLFAVSKFAKDKEVALRRELNECREFLEYLSKRFKDIIITEGNHERRLKSFIKSVIPADIQFLFPDDVLQMVQSGEILKKTPLQNVHIVGSWWIKIFDTIFAHPDNYSNATLKTVQNTSEYFSIAKGNLHKMCVIGHTHKAGKVVLGDVLMMETGCLCHDMDYHNGSNFTKTKWTRAYAVIHINQDGTPDFNKSDVMFV